MHFLSPTINCHSKQKCLEFPLVHSRVARVRMNALAALGYITSNAHFLSLRDNEITLFENQSSSRSHAFRICCIKIVKIIKWL